MNKNIHFIFFFVTIFFLATSIQAQTGRTTLNLTDQKIVTTPESETKTSSNISESKATVKFQQSARVDSLKSEEQKVSNMQSKQVGEKVNYSVQRAQRTVQTNIDESSKTINFDQPLFPELNVIAVEEKISDNALISKEKPAQVVEKIKKAPVENLQINNIVTNQLYISPSKRKYLEEIVFELEKEIQINVNNTSPDMLAKRKELEDLKRLLAQ